MRKSPGRADALEDFQARVLFVTRNLVEYGNYKKDPGKAARVVRRHFPARSPEECREALDRMAAFYTEAVDLVDRNRDFYRERYDGPRRDPPPPDPDFESEFLSRHPWVLRPIARWTILFIWDWRHRR